MSKGPRLSIGSSRPLLLSRPNDLSLARPQAVLPPGVPLEAVLAVARIREIVKRTHDGAVFFQGPLSASQCLFCHVTGSCRRPVDGGGESSSAFPPARRAGGR
jgi:hypothetical protein